jgi:hypothetical protein
MGSARALAQGLVAVALIVASVPDGSAAGHAKTSEQSVRLGVVTLPRASIGPIDRKTWAVHADGVAMKSVVVETPLVPHFRPSALAALKRTRGVAIGTADWYDKFAFQGTSGAWEFENGFELRDPIVSGGCRGTAEPPGATEDVWRIAGVWCLDISVSWSNPARLRLAIQGTATEDVTSLLTGLELTLRAQRTAAGRLLGGNPADALTQDSRAEVVTCETFSPGVACGGDGPTLESSVREVVGGRTGVTLGFTRSRVRFGQRVVFSGQVLRAGSPAPGAEIYLQPEIELGSLPGHPFPGIPQERTPRPTAITGPDGRFRVSLRPRITARWRVLALAGGEPRAATLEHTPRRVVGVVARTPSISVRRLRTLPDGRIAARVLVRSRSPASDCQLFVGRSRRWGNLSRGNVCVFRVVDAPGTRLRGRVFEGAFATPGYLPYELLPAYSRVVHL